MCVCALDPYLGLSEARKPVDFRWTTHYLTPEHPILLADRAPPDPFTNLENVVVALSAGYDPIYCYYAAISTLLWARMGFRPVVFMYASAEIGCPIFVHEQILASGGFIYAMNESKLGTDLPHRQLQNARLTACNLPGLHNSTVIVITDADTLAFTRTPFDRLVSLNRSKLYFNMWDGDQTPLMAHLVASAAVFRQLLGSVPPSALPEDVLTKLVRQGEMVRDQVLVKEYFDQHPQDIVQNPWTETEVPLHNNAPKALPRFRQWIMWLWVKPYLELNQARLKEEDYTALGTFNKIYLAATAGQFEENWQELLVQATAEVQGPADMERFYAWTAPDVKRNEAPPGRYRSAVSSPQLSAQKGQTTRGCGGPAMANLTQPAAPPGNPEYEVAMQVFKNYFRGQGGVVARYGAFVPDACLATVGASKDKYSLLQAAFSFVSDQHITDAIKSIALECALRHRRCHALDLGANLGFV